MSASISSKIQRASTGLTASPGPTLLSHIRSPRQTALFVSGTWHSGCASLSRGLQFPDALGIIRTSQSRPAALPQEPEVTPPSCYYRACLHISSLFTPFPSATATGPYVTQCPLFPGCEYVAKKLPSILPVQSCVWYVGPSP